MITVLGRAVQSDRAQSTIRQMGQAETKVPADGDVFVEEPSMCLTDAPRTREKSPLLRPPSLGTAHWKDSLQNNGASGWLHSSAHGLYRQHGFKSTVF